MPCRHRPETMNHMQPVVKLKRLQPVVKLKRLQPVVKLKRLQPVVKLKRLQPVVKLKRLQPVVKLKRLQPVVKLKRLQPVVKLKRLQPVVKLNRLQPVVKLKRLQPVVKLKRLQPVVKLKRLQPVVKLKRLQLPANFSSEESVSLKRTNGSSVEYESDENHGPKELKPTSMCDTDRSGDGTLHLEDLPACILPFVCCLCEDRKFALRTDLICHTMIHTDTKTGTCLTCKKSFDKHYRLREHMFRQHTVDKNLTCSVCKKEFSRLVTRNIHMRCHNKRTKGFHCELCGSTFKRKVSLHLHLAEHTCKVPQTTPGSKRKLVAHVKTHEEGEFFSKTFNDKHRLGSHMLLLQKPKSTSLCNTESSEGGNLPFACRICEDGKFTSRKDLIDHTLLHTDNKTSTCLACKKSFDKNHRLREHMLRKHTVDTNLTCTVCKKEFPRLRDRAIHMRCHNRQRSGFDCELCGNKFKTKDSLRLHVAEHKCNVRQTTFACKQKLSAQMKTHDEGEFSRKTFKDKLGLGTNILTHTCTAENLFSCEICEKNLSRKNRLTVRRHLHNRSLKNYLGDIHGKKLRFLSSVKCHRLNLVKCHRLKHGIKKRFKCDKCDKAFTSRNGLGGHILRVHKQIKDFLCIVCNKAFINIHSLTAHMVTHTKEKPFSCNVCGKGFGIKGLLKVHMKTHSALRPYSCTLCTRRFSQPDPLKKHVATHSEERPYSCVLCCKSYKSSSNLQDHMLTHTGERPHPCPVCGRSFSRPYRLKRHLARVHKDGQTPDSSSGACS